ncbi:hypothetical protein [Paenibacillus sp. 7516]|uniref:hypothetical protein n=1 Tax=Paenibacillus sp. 7516 TaxID=2022549 RepID=UPI000BA7D9EE|nr:hypothetical protein [Paenibacillus sp. 7516]PAF31895.1 hypothetical protein CHI14_09600 [Paenibacillus sp. 7516]
MEHRPYPKSVQLRGKRIKPTQKQMGDISNAVDERVKDRSQGICEACGRAGAAQRAHLTGRTQIDHKTKSYDLAHLCLECHGMLDGTESGRRFRRLAANIIEYELNN